MDFSGTFDYTLDAKNRLTVPAKMRASLNEPLMLARGTQKCLSVWRKRDFQEFVDDALEGTTRLDPKRDRIIRFFVSNSFEAELDSAGRVMLPPPLLEYGSLKKDVVVNGMGDRIEIWDRPSWHAYNDAQDIDDLTALFADSLSA